MHRVIGPQRSFHTPMIPARGHQMVVQIGRELERLVAEHVLLQQIQGLALFLWVDYHKRIGCVGVPLVAAADADAPYIARRKNALRGRNC